VRVLADVAKVDSAPAALEEEQSVKVLEEECVWLRGGRRSATVRRTRRAEKTNLVHRAENGLSCCGELAEEADDVVGRLAVEACAARGPGQNCMAGAQERSRRTRSWLVEKEEQLRLGR